MCVDTRVKRDTLFTGKISLERHNLQIAPAASLIHSGESFGTSSKYVLLLLFFPPSLNSPNKLVVKIEMKIFVGYFVFYFFIFFPTSTQRYCEVKIKNL